MRISRSAWLVGVAVALSLALPAAPAHAGKETIQDDSAYDVPHRDIDMKSLTVTYNSKGASAKLRFKDLRKQKRLRLFVAFFNKPSDDPFAPVYGNFLELRINEKGKIRKVNWVIDPDDAFDGYHAEKCRGIKMKADYDKDVITYKLPNRCSRFLDGRGYISSYASTRKFKAKHWDDGDPAATTGDWFDTTYDLRVEL
jgi:hypothetical protein